MVTKRVIAKLTRDEVLVALGAHLCGHWGNVSEKQWKKNDRIIRAGRGRLLSVHRPRPGVELYVFTDWDKSRPRECVHRALLAHEHGQDSTNYIYLPSR
jgi:hypothetical protein